LPFLHLREACGNKVGFSLEVIEGYDGIIKGKITLREFKVVYSCGWQAFDEVAQVIAEIANRST
jgi:hypothetical protein